MKKKDIITLSVATIVIVVCIYFGIKLFSPSSGSQKSTEESAPKEQTTQIPVEIDENTFKTISTLSDYGKPPLDNIGKSDLFAGF